MKHRTLRFCQEVKFTPKFVDNLWETLTLFVHLLTIYPNLYQKTTVLTIPRQIVE